MAMTTEAGTLFCTQPRSPLRTSPSRERSVLHQIETNATAAAMIASQTALTNTNAAVSRSTDRLTAGWWPSRAKMKATPGNRAKT